ncbi:MAG: nucleotide exchange factor GrpE [Cyanobacteria bacterium P01_D01_bin.73]
MENSGDGQQRIKQWMNHVGCRSWRALAERSGVSLYQIRQLREGEVARMRLETLGQLAKALEVTTVDLLAAVTEISPDLGAGEDLESDEESGAEANSGGLVDSARELAAIQQEYDRLKDEVKNNQDQLWEGFQKDSLMILEPWLLSWYKAVDAVQKNPQIPANRLLLLLRPLDELLNQWSVVQIAPIGEEVAFDPQWHQVAQGKAEPGDRVQVVMPGFRHHGRLLHRAQVRPVNLLE